MSYNSSLKSRYFSKFKSNLISLFSGFAITFLVPRTLGPAMYGVFDFITDFFNNVIAFFQLGTQNAFYTKLSKNQKDNRLIVYYTRFVLLTFFLSFSFVIMSFVFDYNYKIWPDISEKYVIFGLFFSIFTLIISNLKIINDAIGITNKTEKIIIYQKSISILIILPLYYFSVLNLFSFFLFHFFILCFLICYWIKILHNHGVYFFKIKLSDAENKNYFKRFYKFSSPLFMYSFIALICDISDRWLLQEYSGSIQQGYFGFALRVSAICFLFTSAMTPLIMREFSIAYGNKDIKKIANLFKNNIPLLYFIGAFICLFFSFNSDIIITIIGGDQFIAGNIVFIIMSFYPIQQSYGQLSNSLFYATNQTKLYRNIAVFTSLFGLLVTFILIGPSSIGCMQLGAIGLAIKKVFIQFIGVSIGLYYNLKYLNLSIKSFFGHKILVVLILGCLSFFSSFISSNFSNIYAVFLISALIYTLLVILLIYLYPRIIVRSRDEINDFINSIINYFNFKRNEK